LYGAAWTDRIANGWSASTIDSPGVTQLGYQTTLLNSINWWTLVPRATSDHTLVTNGYGSCPTSGSMDGVSCVTDAESSDKSLALIYDPTGAAITVDFSQMLTGGTTTARWYDPTNGSYTTVTGSPFADSSGAQTISPPGSNSAGDDDWVLLLQASGGGGGT
jgi:hypothetical protein